MGDRLKDATWSLHPQGLAADYNHDGKKFTRGQVQIALLMDIRDELKEIKGRLGFGVCSDFLNVPSVLKRIDANTRKPKRKRVKKS